MATPRFLMDLQEKSSPPRLVHHYKNTALLLPEISTFLWKVAAMTHGPQMLVINVAYAGRILLYPAKAPG